MVKNKRLFSWVMCLLFVFSGLLLQEVSANTKKSIPLYGRWKEDARSVSPTIPISAFVSEGVLSIHSRTQRSDITICISKDGEVIYQKMIPASETGYIMINLEVFAPGVYTIELENQWRDILNGVFDKDSWKTDVFD